MADIDPRLYDALRQADAAGDTASAQRLADYIRTQTGTQGQGSTSSAPAPSNAATEQANPFAGPEDASYDAAPAAAAQLGRGAAESLASLPASAPGAHSIGAIEDFLKRKLGPDHPVIGATLDFINPTRTADNVSRGLDMAGVPRAATPGDKTLQTIGGVAATSLLPGGGEEAAAKAASPSLYESFVNLLRGKGVDVDMSQANPESVLARRAKGLVEDAPFVSMHGYKAGQAGQYTKAVLQTLDPAATATEASEGTMLRIKQGIQSALDDAEAKGNVDVTKGLLKDLMAYRSEAADSITDPTTLARLNARVKQLMGKADENGVISGANFRQVKTDVRLDAQSNDPTLKFWANKLKTLMEDNMATALGKEDAAKYADARLRYARYQTVVKALDKQTNQINPQTLHAVMDTTKNADKTATGQIDQPLYKLAQAGAAVLKPSGPNSGTWGRAWAAKALMGAGGAVAGYEGSHGDFMAALGAGALGAAGPALARFVITHPEQAQSVYNFAAKALRGTTRAAPAAVSQANQP